jgi:ElaB/YqjD/DUF883 family membrane-anchored ribosome-binding protein
MKAVQHSHAHRTNHDGGLQHDIKGLRDGVAQLRSDASELIQTAVHAGKSGVAAVQETAGDAAECITSAVTDGLTDLKKRSARSVKTVSKQIGAHPVASTAIALGAGYILARFFSRKS